MMKHLYLFTAVISNLLILTSCQKSADTSIDSIRFDNQLNLQRSTDLVSDELILGTDIDPDPKVYACYPSNNVCLVKRKKTSEPCPPGTSFSDEDRVDVNFENVDGRLKINFNLENINKDTKEKYFNEEYFIIESDKYFPEELTKELELDYPYLIQKGEYLLTKDPESDFIFSIEI